MRVAAFALLLALASAAFGAAGAAGGRAGPPLHGGETSTAIPAENPHWSGYAVSGSRVSFTSVTGSWQEPIATCPSTGPHALSAIWVGLGGYVNSKLLAQVGTDANCGSSGKPSYYAWFEMLPYVAYRIQEPVSAGDTIVGTVRLLKGSLAELRVRNETRHWTFMRQIVWATPDTTTAEWIVEAPYSCHRFTCHQAPLANFGSVTIHDIAAVGNGKPGTLNNPSWTRTPIHLVPCPQRATTSGTIRVNSPTRSRAGAAPGATSTDGKTFAIAWQSDAGDPGPCNAQATGQIGGTPDHTKG